LYVAKMIVEICFGIVNNFLLLQQKRTAIVCKFPQDNANGDWYGSKTIS
jgi:hypothetical protein